MVCSFCGDFTAEGATVPNASTRFLPTRQQLRPWFRRGPAAMPSHLPRLCVAGDTSGYHGGCDAVMRTLWRLAAAKGWQVVPEGATHDALLVNGEGNMHHGSKRFHHKMRLLNAAVAAGRPAFLVNSVWQENPPDYDDLLPRLNGIFVREVLSQRELAERHGVHADVVPDASFFDRLPRFTLRRNFRGRPAVTDFYLKPQGEVFRRHRFERLDTLFPDARPLPFLDLSWGRIVASLRTAGYLITGRHHAVYAACVARVPFIASEGNTHKIRGLVTSAQADILVADTPEEIPTIRAANLERTGEYERLFSWIGSHDIGRIIPNPGILR